MMIVLDYADAYGISLLEARRFTDEEKPQYAEWFRDYGLVSLLGTEEPLPHVEWQDLPKRKADGEFLGCSNRAWILTDEEAAYYRTMEAERARDEQEKKEAEERARDEADAQRAAEGEKIRARFDRWDVIQISKDCFLHTLSINGEVLKFHERDIFDVGIVINPEYSVAPGHPNGGLCNKNSDGVMVWMDLGESGWKEIRPLTENEAACIMAIRSLGKFAGHRIRM